MERKKYIHKDRGGDRYRDEKICKIVFGIDPEKGILSQTLGSVARCFLLGTMLLASNIVTIPLAMTRGDGGVLINYAVLAGISASGVGLGTGFGLTLALKEDLKERGK